MSPPAYDEAVRAWAAQLRAGASTPWSEFVSGPHPGPSPSLSGLLPTAPQLEVVRRLAELAPQDHAADFAGLADCVLGTVGPGRGLVDVPLSWPEPAHRFGSPAMDPADVPADELLRVCLGVLGRLLGQAPVSVPVPRRNRRRPWRGRFSVHGSPRTAALVRTCLLGRGLAEGGRRAEHLVFAGPFESMMAEHWAALVRDGAITRWDRLWRHAAVNQRVPPVLDVPATATRLAGEHGVERVHVVVGRDPAEALAEVGRVLGVKVPADAVDEEGSDTVSFELWRRLNRVLDQTVGPARRRELAAITLPQALRPVDDDGAADGNGDGDGRLAPPAGQLAWAREAGVRMSEDLRSAPYPVYGDPALVVPAVTAGPRKVSVEDTLARALVACIRVWRLAGPRPPSQGRD